MFKMVAMTLGDGMAHTWHAYNIADDSKAPISATSSF